MVGGCSLIENVSCNKNFGLSMVHWIPFMFWVNCDLWGLLNVSRFWHVHVAGDLNVVLT